MREVVEDLERAALRKVRRGVHRDELAHAARKVERAQPAVPHLEQPVLARLRRAQDRAARVAERQLRVHRHEGELRRA